jgi:hypothetical protein
MDAPFCRRVIALHIYDISAPVYAFLVSDAYLAALTMESGSEFISRDRDFNRFPRLRWRPSFWRWATKTARSLGTAKLVRACLGKAAAALWCVREFSRGWQDEALPLAAEAEGLRVAIDAEFPGHQAYHRPGLDDAIF